MTWDDVIKKIEKLEVELKEAGYTVKPGLGFLKYEQPLRFRKLWVREKRTETQ